MHESTTSERPRPPLSGVTVTSPTEVDRLLRDRAFPFWRDGWFVFAFYDPMFRVREVRLRHGLVGHRHPPRFRNLNYGLRVLELYAPHVDRVEYQFELVDSFGRSTLVLDPLNVIRGTDPFGSKSVVYTDRYAEPVLAAPPRSPARGTLSHVSVPGPGGAQWDAALWTSPGLDDATAALTFFVLDGADYYEHASLGNIIANLVDDQQLPCCRALLLNPTQRDAEYSANEETAQLLTDVIPKFLGKGIALPDDPAQRIGVGASLGGLTMLHAHVLCPGFFGGLVLQSGSFFQPETDSMETTFPHFDRVTSFIGRLLRREMDALPIPIYMTCGSGGENLANNERMAAHLQQVGCPVMFEQVRDAHNWIAWRDCIGPGLVHIAQAHTVAAQDDSV